jgi:hypothetical protein
MSLVDFAEEYVASKGLARNPVHSASRFVRLMGDMQVGEVNSEVLRRFRIKAEALKLGAWTIRDTLKDLRTLVRSTGGEVQIDRVKPPHPEPQPVDLELLDTIWPHCAGWSRQWLVLSFWTGLRLADSIQLQQNLSPEKLCWTAGKTGHRQQWPIPPWIRPFLQAILLPYTPTVDWSKAIVRAELQRVCKLANVPRILPSQIRDTSLREWCRADFHVGQIVHGCRLGVIGHYVHLLDILEPVAPKVRLPQCFGATSNECRESLLLSHFRRLDPSAQSLVAGTAERLAVG